MSDAQARAYKLIHAIYNKSPEFAARELESHLAGLLAMRDEYRKQRDAMAEELEIARRDIAILRKQRTEARRAAKVLAEGPTGPIDLDHDDALRLALNYR